MMSLALFVDPKCKKEGTRILFQKNCTKKSSFLQAERQSKFSQGGSLSECRRLREEL